jgi:hypothetical protein
MYSTCRRKLIKLASNGSIKVVHNYPFPLPPFLYIVFLIVKSMPSCFHFGRGDGDTQQPEYNFLIECDLVHKHFVKYCKLNNPFTHTFKK